MAPVTRPAADQAGIAADDGMEIGERTSLWFDTNSKLVNVLLGAIIVALLAWTVYKWIHQGQQATASRAFASVLEEMGKAQTEQDETKRRDALNGAITAADNVIKNYPGQYVGRQAQLVLGNANYELATQAGQGATALNSARDAYQKYISISSDPTEKAAGYLALGNVLQDQLFISQDTKIVPDAENAYKQAIDLGKGTYLESESKLSLANMNIALDNRQDEAAKLLQSVMQDRKVEAPPADEKAKPAAAEGEHDLTPEQIAEIKSQTKLSYAQRAKAALDRLPALKVAK